MPSENCRHGRKPGEDCPKCVYEAPDFLLSRAEDQARLEARLIPTAPHWLGKPLEHGLKAGPLMLVQQGNDTWAVRLTVSTSIESVPIGGTGASMRRTSTSTSLLLVATSESVDRLTREWLASLANVRAE